MASTPDANPDSMPEDQSDSPEQVTQPGGNERENVEEDSAGDPGGTGGTGGTNHRVDTDITS